MLLLLWTIKELGYLSKIICGHMVLRKGINISSEGQEDASGDRILIESD
jgi:hypothetical protein